MTININIMTEVELHEPVLMAAWPGMGHVALKAYVYLHEALRAQNLAFVEEPEFFRLPGINIQDGLVQSTMLPQSGFYYWKHPGGSGDILFFQLSGPDNP